MNDAKMMIREKVIMNSCAQDMCSNADLNKNAIMKVSKHFYAKHLSILPMCSLCQ